MDNNVEKSSVGAVIAIIVIVVLLVLGAFYFWNKNDANAPISPANTETEGSNVNLNATSSVPPTDSEIMDTLDFGDDISTDVDKL